MRTSLIRSRLREGRVVRFISLMYPTDVLPSHAARAGFDGVLLDNEHASWDRREIQRMLALHHAAGIDCIIRPASRNAPDLYHLLEDGATGFLFQMVNSAEEAEALVKALKFPPLGERGLSAPAFDSGYTWGDSVIDYMRAANEQTVIAAMIETPQAVACIDEIAAVRGIDALFMGPADLSLRLGCFDRWDDPPMREAHARMAAAAARNGIAWGRPGRSAADIRTLVDAGARFILRGGDYAAVTEMVSRYGRDFSDG
jgi:4-hydroxy-2-oxoheptanedioate aldolase